MSPGPTRPPRRPSVRAPPPGFKPSERAANFVLVKIAVGKEENAFKSLKEMPGISGIHQVYGEWDLVLIIRERETKRFRNIVLNKIRGVDGVIDTNTLIAAE
jgi:DNA-binding Lrp family transcriptional regulator